MDGVGEHRESSTPRPRRRGRVLAFATECGQRRTRPGPEARFAELSCGFVDVWRWLRWNEVLVRRVGRSQQ